MKDVRQVCSERKIREVYRACPQLQTGGVLRNPAAAGQRRPGMAAESPMNSHLLGPSALPEPVAPPPDDCHSDPAARSYATPAGPLGAALNRLGQESDTLITFVPELVAGVQTSGARGSLTAAQALAALLAGTHLEAVHDASGTYVNEAFASIDHALANGWKARPARGRIPALALAVARPVPGTPRPAGRRSGPTYRRHDHESRPPSP
ncbi:hypothetical protein [Xylophilus sp.]|uniref:hypothetical protein n=1 Tax=Xylophilus sp. TaxID=2653893 RepID=UPI002D7EE59C|nr:hypothetical protein [Xylophilus sp.]